MQTTKINNRRYLGNKYRILPFIKKTIAENCGDFETFADIFAGTGAVASAYIDKKIITNDILYSNYLCHLAWFSNQDFDEAKIENYINYFNSDLPCEENYMTQNFSGTYFSAKVCSKIGFVREFIEGEFSAKKINEKERAILITSLLYGMDRTELKSKYCTREAPKVFADLIENLKAKFIIVSYNNMTKKGNDRSNARISDSEILQTLQNKGSVQTFSQELKAFTTGKSEHLDNEKKSVA